MVDNDSKLPIVSVLMSVYNGERYLKEAIESILNQTFRDFEFIIIDGGSTDGSPAILASYQRKDDRIRVYYQKNQRLVDSLNLGCQLAQGKYIARMDADDISLPERLAKQVEFMDSHPEIGVLGTWVQHIDENGRPSAIERLLTSPGTIGWSLIFRNSLDHPSIMMRRDVIEQLGFYDLGALQAEDYDLWARASFVTRLANIPETLLRYRVWGGSSCSRHVNEVEQYTTKVVHRTIERLLGSEIPFETAAGLRRLVIGPPLDNSHQVEKAAMLIEQLYRAYLSTNSLNRKEARYVAQDAGMKLLVLAASNTKLSLRTRFSLSARALRLSPPLIWSRQVIVEGSRKVLKLLAARA